jgi:hypothetical protein
LLVGHEGLERLRGDDLHVEGHAPVVEPTELGAHGREPSRLRGPDLQGVVDTGDEVLLHEEGRHEERVDDVGRHQAQPDIGANGEDERGGVVGVAGDCYPLGGVAEPPAPLEPGDLHGQVGVLALLGDPVLGPHGEPEEQGDDDQRDDGVEDLDRDVGVGLLGQVAGRRRPGPAVPEDRPQDQPGDQGAQGDAGAQQDAPEVEDVLALAAGGLGYATPAAARGEEDGPCERCQRERRPLRVGMPTQWVISYNFTC